MILTWSHCNIIKLTRLCLAAIIHTLISTLLQEKLGLSDNIFAGFCFHPPAQGDWAWNRLSTRLVFASKWKMLITNNYFLHVFTETINWNAILVLYICTWSWQVLVCSCGLPNMQDIDCWLTSDATFCWPVKSSRPAN